VSAAAETVADAGPEAWSATVAVSIAPRAPITNEGMALQVSVGGVVSIFTAALMGNSWSPKALTLAAYSVWAPSPVIAAPPPVNEHTVGRIAPNAGGGAVGSSPQLICAPSVAETVALTADTYQPFAPFGDPGLNEIVETGGMVISRITWPSASAIRTPPPGVGATAAGESNDAEVAGPPSPA
jgi:hypothetical protein